MKKLFACVFLFLFSSSVIAACSRAAATDAPKFCETFKTAAQCHCTTGGLPAAMCSNIRLLYQRLIVTFGTLEKTCEFQHDTTKEDCLDSWKCYLNGGKNAAGKLCNGTGRSCP